MRLERTRATRASGLALLGLAAGIASIPAGCEQSSPPLRDCFARVWVPTSDGPTTVLGSFNGWTGVGTPLEEHDPEWRLLRLELPPGEHQYLLESGGERRLDPNNPLTSYRAGDRAEVNLLLVPDCESPSIKVEAAEASEVGAVSVSARFLAAGDPTPLARATVTAATIDGQPIEVASVDPSSGRIELAASGLPVGRHTIVIEAASASGRVAEATRASVFVAPRAPTPADAVLYQIVVDRFLGDGGTPLADPPTPGSRAGGTLAGVRAALDDGYFDRLGVTGLWLSPVYQNPTEARAGLDGNLYEGYHGYWVTNDRVVEPRFGGEAALRELVAAAHARGIQVLLDVVPNHVYEDNPTYLENVDRGWFQPPGCVCGTAECPWSDNIQTCWFTDYLPDFEMRDPDVVQHTLAETRFWVHGFDVDGVRVDAVPMMPRSATRRIARDLRGSTFPRESTFLLGEVFTGPGLGGLAQLKTHLGPAGLDSVFDFPLMWALRDGIASRTADFEEVEAILVAEEEELAGSGATLARMLDNHDVSRFISVANGDAFGSPWLEPAAQPENDEPYDRQELGLAALFTLPGLVVLYHGDEVGIAGAGDPDCRRVLPTDGELSPRRLALREATARLSALRSCSESLRRGDRVPLLAEGTSYVYVRGSDSDAPVLVVLSASDAPETIQFDAASLPPGLYVDTQTGEALDVASAAITVDLPPRSYRIYLPSGAACL
jgi:glycosidase